MDTNKVAKELTEIANMVAEKRSSRNRKADIEDVRDEFDKKTEELMSDLGLDADDVTEFTEGHRYYDADYYLEAGNEEWIGYKSGKNAVRAAEDYVREQLEDEPELFTQSWLQNFIYVTDTDVRLIASDEADAYLDGMDDQELIDMAGNEDSYWELQEEYDEAEGENDSRRMKAVQKQMEDMVEESREELHDDRYEYVKRMLDSDPAEYFIDELGAYDREDLLKQNFIRIDVDRAAKDAINTDGVAHFLAHYDHNEVDGPNGTVWFRVN